MLLNKFFIAGGSLGALLVLLYLNNKKSESVKYQPRITFDQLTQKYSVGCDKLIANSLEQEKDLNYISGYFIVSLDEQAKKINIKAQLYFQNQAGKWTEKTSTDTLSINRLVAEDLEELRKTGEIKYEVEAPEINQLVSNH